MKAPIFYHYRGQIESGKGFNKRSTWIDGYSANGLGGGALYPWEGKRACQADAKSQNKRAVFIEGDK